MIQCTCDTIILCIYIYMNIYICIDIYGSNFCGRTIPSKNGHIFSNFDGSLQPHFSLQRNNFCFSGLVQIWPPQKHKMLCLLSLFMPLYDRLNFQPISIIEFQSITQGGERESKHSALYFWGGHTKTSPEIQNLCLQVEKCGYSEPSKLEKM